MRELRYKPVLNREEMCLVHELLHDELMRFTLIVAETKSRHDPTKWWEEWEIANMQAKLDTIRRLKAKFGSVR